MTKQLPINQILLGDSLTILPALPAASVDLVFADPPYNLQLQNALWRPNMTQVDAVNDDWDQFDSFEAYDAFTRAWLQAARRVMKPSATMWVSGTYHNIFRVGAIMQDLGFWILNTITWYKPNAMPNFRGTRMKNDVEFLIWAKHSAGGRYTFNHHLMKRFNDFNQGKQLGSVWQIKICGGEERLRDENGKKLHSTQTPEELLRRILLASSAVGDRVLDPFSGSGTTAAVARRLRRQYIGIERSALYHAASLRRVEAVEALAEDDDELGQAQMRVPRIPFKSLLRLGYLQTGQHLYLDEPAATATILENGRLLVKGHSASIHGMARLLKGTPSANGWMHWYYEDPAGQRHSIDQLRRLLRTEQPPA